jgi:hypothetical protein
MDGINYIAACDPSGGRNDSFTAAIAHKGPDGIIVLDVAFERKSPCNPSEVVAEIVKLMAAYRCHRITGDHYAAGWVVESFAKHGVHYVQSDRDRSAVYMDMLPLFTSGRARLLDNAKLISEFAGLERRTFSTGRDRIDHPQHCYDDLSNSAAIAMSLVEVSRPHAIAMTGRYYFAGFASRRCERLAEMDPPPGWHDSKEGHQSGVGARPTEGVFLVKDRHR